MNRLGWVAAAMLVFLLQIVVAQAAEKVLYSFCGQQNCADGEQPLAGLTDVNGKLYGTTYEGGAQFYYGEVFSIDRKSGAETVVHSFQDNGTDGFEPYSRLINLNGILYGTTAYGGAGSEGTLFSIEPESGAETIDYAFQHDGTDGNEPYAGLIQVNGVLYGTTSTGGTDSEGTVFSFDPATEIESVIYSFRNNGADGIGPQTSLTDVTGTLCGTTLYGGTHNGGTVFCVDQATGAETVLHSFDNNGKDGVSPEAALIKINGKLYGTTVFGGAYGSGTVFSLNPKTGKEAVLWSFQNNGDGFYPRSSLVTVNGLLYGTTVSGGSYGRGTVFSLDPTTRAELVVYSFAGSGDGQFPYAGLLNIKGLLYGTTEEGGTYDEGSVFSISP